MAVQASELTSSAASPRRLGGAKARTVSELRALAKSLETLVSVSAALSRRPDGISVEMNDITDLLIDRHLEAMDCLREAEAASGSERWARSHDLLAFDLGCDEEVTSVALSAVQTAFPGRY